MKAAVRMLVGSAILMAACSDVPEPTAPAQSEGNGAGARARVSSPMDEIASEVDAFGGMFLDASGTPTAYATDMSRADEVRAALADFARSVGRSPSDIRILPAEFSYSQLNDAFERATHAAMPLEGTVFTDLDEAVNRVVVGVDNAGRAQAARLALQRAGLEEGSYDVIVTSPIRQAATLRDEFNPTQGGIQIHFTQYLCTLGANAMDGTQRSFITNSHCTATQGGVENTLYYQPTSTVNGTAIATEVEDPAYVKGGACPRGKKCRYSDSSRALYSADQASALGAIALTTGANNGSLTVAGSASISGKAYNVVVGQVVNKVGRTTGWTQAPVTRTCVNTGVQGSQIMQFCQTFVSNGSTAVVGSGDSGSSVWVGSGNVQIAGLLWGGSSDNKTFIFSPIGQIEQELGVLTFN
jgi:hypothetical protein